MKKFSFLFAALFAAMSMFAAEVTFNPADLTAAENTAIEETVGGVTMNVSSGTVTNEQIRIFKSQTITFSASSNITKIVFTCTANGTAKYGPGCFAAQDGYSYEAKVGTWEGEAPEVTFTASTNQVRATSIVVTLADGSSTIYYYLVGSMTNWEINEDYKFSKNTAAEGEEYKLDVTLEANAEFKGRKVVDGEADAWYPDNCGECNKVVETAGDYTIYLRPNGDGGDDWHYNVLYAEYHEPVVIEAITCAEVYSKAKNDEVALNDVVVTYVNGKNVWVKDETGSMLLFLPANATFQAGDVLSGAAGVVDIYNGIHEVKPTADQVAAITATAGEAPAAEELEALVAADVNKYVVLKGVTFETAGEFTTASKSSLVGQLGENNVTIYNNFKFAYSFEVAKIYDVVGVVTLYSNNPQIYFISAEVTGEIAPVGPEFYLAGWIGGAYYAYDEDEASQSEYKFVNNRIVVNFDEDAYLLVRTYENTPKFYGADDNVESEEENFEAVLADGGEGMVTIPANREATIQISLDESGAMTMSVALAHLR